MTTQPNPFGTPTNGPTFDLRSASFADGDKLPAVHLGGMVGGADLSPELSWSGFPPETQSFAVSCFDQDAPTGIGFMHWVAFNIPGDINALAEGAGGEPGSMPPGAITLGNDIRVRSYIGPSPHPGSGSHRYVFAVHALDVSTLEIDPDLTPAVLGFHLGTHSLARASIVALVQG